MAVSTRPKYHLIDLKTERIQSVSSPGQPLKRVDVKRAGSPSWSPIESPSGTCCHSGTDRGRPPAAPCCLFPAGCAVPSPTNGRLLPTGNSLPGPRRGWLKATWSWPLRDGRIHSNPPPESPGWFTSSSVAESRVRCRRPALIGDSTGASGGPCSPSVRRRRADRFRYRRSGFEVGRHSLRALH